MLTSSHDREILLRDVYSFPLSITTNYSSLPSSFSADLPFYAYNRALTLPPALDRGDAKTKVTKSTQAGWAEIVRKEGNFSVGSGEMEEKYRFSQGKETYTEEIKGRLTLSESIDLSADSASPSLCSGEFDDRGSKARRKSSSPE